MPQNEKKSTLLRRWEMLRMLTVNRSDNGLEVCCTEWVAAYIAERRCLPINKQNPKRLAGHT